MKKRRNANMRGKSNHFLFQFRFIVGIKGTYFMHHTGFLDAMALEKNINKKHVSLTIFNQQEIRFFFFAINIKGKNT